MSDYDLIVRNGTVIDGSGADPRQCDVAIKDGRIASLNPGPHATASRVIDAAGKLVTPGFVDVHTHYDGQATWDQEMAPSSWHGALLQPGHHDGGHGQLWRRFCAVPR